MAQTQKNSQIPETQEMDSQSTLISPQFYTCEDDDLIIWGQVKDPEGNVVSLTTPLTFFGREDQKTDFTRRSYVFNQQRMNKIIYDRLSKIHFQIERDLKKDPSTNFEPAIITCKGRNGVVVNDVRLNVDQKRILKEGDVICLPPNHRLFVFNYAKTAENSIEKACKIHKQYYIGELIGRGACGEVRKVLKIVPSAGNKFEEYAIKCVPKPRDTLSGNMADVIKSLMNEVNIMKTINGTHVLKLFDYFDSIENIILVFPYMAGGDLLNRITKCPSRRMDEHDAKFFFTQLLRGISYLHRKGITHRDIKPENVLLSDNSNYAILKIADFGLSKMQDTMRTQCGTEYYVAPEVLKKRSSYTNAVDIWSAGVVYFAMMTGKMAFSNNHHGNVRDNIVAGRFDYSPPWLWEKHPDAKSFTNLMLQINPRNRWTANSLLHSSYLRSDELLTRRIEKAYSMHKIECDYVYDHVGDTDDLEKTLVNVSICEDERENENPPKRQKFNA